MVTSSEEVALEAWCGARPPILATSAIAGPQPSQVVPASSPWQRQGVVLIPPSRRSSWLPPEPLLTPPVAACRPRFTDDGCGRVRGTKT
jgi:hypothetical protein